MPLTSPDEIAYPDTTYPDGFVTAMAAMAGSVQAAFDARAVRGYRWANSTARAAQAGMAAGDTGYQIDTGVYYFYSGSAWAIWQTGSPIAFTPSWTNFTAGNAVQTWSYTVSGGRCFVSGVTVLGTTSSMGSAPRFALPVTSAIFSTVNILLGHFHVLDSGTTRYTGDVYLGGSGMTMSTHTVSGAAVFAVTGISSTAPMPWAVNDTVSIRLDYPIT